MSRFLRFFAIAFSLTLGLGSSAGPLRGQELTADQIQTFAAFGCAAYRHGGDWLRWVAEREATPRLLYILSGRPMGGGGNGWSGPAQTRFTWTWLAHRCDTDGDGTISRSEFAGPAAYFELLDRDRDGKVTPADLDWSENSPLLKASTQARSLLSLVDDGDGRLSPEEWQQLYKKLAGAKGQLSHEDLMPLFLPKKFGGFNRPGVSKDKTRLTMLKAFFDGDMGTWNEGPRLGDLAPDFTLPTAEGDKITLSASRGKKPVVLMFGSITCPPYRQQFAVLDEIQRRHRDKVDFLCVYTREAHPQDGVAVASDEVAKSICQPHTFAERTKLACGFCDLLKVNMPVVIDDMNDRVGQMYSGMPSRFYIVDAAGRIAFKGGRGPFGLKTGELEQALVMLLMETQPQTAAARPTE